MTEHIWQTSRRALNYGEKVLVMGIMNVTPDSFSDGGRITSLDDALNRAEEMIAEGADIIDVGGESSRPNSKRISVAEEIARVVPVIDSIKKRFDVAISIDTSRSAVAKAAVSAGAEIINDISGLSFDGEVGSVAATHKTGLILMHLRGSFETMHSHEPVADIVEEVTVSLRRSLEKALQHGVRNNSIAFDTGIGFSKTPRQNLELIAKLDELCSRFSGYPFLIGVSRKSFIGKVLDEIPVDQRLSGSLASAAIAVWNGARIIRAHDVKDTVAVTKIVEAIKREL